MSDTSPYSDTSALLVVYMAHPIGRDPFVREMNLARARRWFAYLIATYPQHAFVAPWLLYCAVLDESDANRERGIRDDLAVLARCDAMWMVGGARSPGMREEQMYATVRGITVRSFLDLGPEPPVVTP